VLTSLDTGWGVFENKELVETKLLGTQLVTSRIWLALLNGFGSDEGGWLVKLEEVLQPSRGHWQGAGGDNTPLGSWKGLSELLDTWNWLGVRGKLDWDGSLKFTRG